MHLLVLDALLLSLRSSIDGSAATAARLSRLRVRVDDPVRRLSIAVILYSHETVVKGKVVADRILNTKWENVMDGLRSSLRPPPIFLGF